MKVGLFFGSFNPVHTGHLIIANHILNQKEHEKIWFIVSPQNPFKTDQSLLNEHSRFHLVSEAVKNDERIVANDVEFLLPRPSFTSSTLALLKENYPDNIFSIIMGSDSFQNINKWKDYESITAGHKILIYRRPGYEIENKINAQIEILNAPLLGISSTEIRGLIRQGKSIRYLVPDKVRDEIERNGYYKSDL